MRPLPNLRNYRDIYLEGLRKATKEVSQDSRSPGQNFKPGPPKYEVGELTSLLRRSVF